MKRLLLRFVEKISKTLHSRGSEIAYKVLNLISPLFCNNFFSLSLILASSGLIQFRGCLEMMNKIADSSYGRYTFGLDSTNFCDSAPVTISDKTTFEATAYFSPTEQPAPQTTVPTKFPQQSTKFPNELHLNTEIYVKIGIYVVVCIICLGLRSLISLLESCLIIKNKTKLKLAKLIAENLKFSLTIFLIFCAIFELLCYLNFDENVKLLLSKLK